MISKSPVGSRAFGASKAGKGTSEDACASYEWCSEGEGSTCLAVKSLSTSCTLRRHIHQTRRSEEWRISIERETPRLPMPTLSFRVNNSCFSGCEPRNLLKQVSPVILRFLDSTSDSAKGIPVGKALSGLSLEMTRMPYKNRGVSLAKLIPYSSLRRSWECTDCPCGDTFEAALNTYEGNLQNE